MSDANYTIEFAKSGRSSCKKCKDTIAAKEIRMGTHVKRDEDSNMVSWHHPACFSMPRKFSTGANKITAQDFVATVLEDTTGGEILPAKAEEIAEAIAAKAPKKQAEEVESSITELKVAFLSHKANKDQGTEPDAKKLKSVDKARLDAYTKYQGMKTTELGDILAWNHQFKSGNKTYQLEKVIDGEVNGRLGRCVLCAGKLKLKEGGETVVCNGSFDEDTQQKLTCSFAGPSSDAPRWKPWYSAETTEEENAEMDRLINEARGIEDEATQASDPDVSKLVKAANKLDWGLIETKGGVRTFVGQLVDLFLNHPGKTLDIPQERQDAIKKVGPRVVQHKDKPASEVVSIIIQEFGFVEKKQEKAAKKEATIESAVACPKNAPLVAIFQELAELYLKEGNRNAGGSYNKATVAIKQIKFEVTEENAMGLGKPGKNKVANIGKGTAEKMLEFLQTGTVQKLEEKRADAA